jgi:hypothetical protein
MELIEVKGVSMFFVIVASSIIGAGALISYFTFLNQPIFTTKPQKIFLTPEDILNQTVVIFSNYTGKGEIIKFYANITSTDWCKVEKFKISYYGQNYECEPYCPSPDEARLKCVAMLPLETPLEQIYFPQSKEMVEFEKSKTAMFIQNLKTTNTILIISMIALVFVILFIIFNSYVKKYLLSFGWS